MSNEANKPEDKRTAAQRLMALEEAVGNLYNTQDLITRDLGMLKNAIRLLNNKLSAVVQATSSGEQINDEVLDRIMVQNNVNDLANKVTNLLVNGLVTPEEQVSENSFVVIKETDDTGKVTNPRVQFSLKTMQPELQGKLVGAKVGDKLNFQDGKLLVEILESYKIQEKPAAEEETSAEAATATAEAAPADAPSVDASAAAPAAEPDATTTSAS